MRTSKLLFLSLLTACDTAPPSLCPDAHGPVADGAPLADFATGAGDGGVISSSSLCANCGDVRELPLPAGGQYATQLLVAGDNTVWALDTDASRVYHLTPGGAYATFNVCSDCRPLGMTFGADGALWMTENLPGSQAHIHRMTTGGQTTTFPLPSVVVTSSIALGPDGALWFVEVGQGVARLDPGSGKVTEIPTPGRFAYGMVAGPDGNLWFGEQSNPNDPQDRIVKMTTAGGMTETVIDARQLRGLAVGGNLQVWFIGSEGNVGFITTEGKVTKFSPPRPGSFNGVARASDGIYLSDSRHRIAHIDATGHTRYWALLDPAESLAVTTDNHIWYGTNAGYIGVLTP